MYDHDREDIDVLGWQEFILRQWESIFLGYRSTADELVRTEIVEREDRALASARNSAALLDEMTEVLEGLADALVRMPRIPAGQLADLLKQHTRLARVVTGESEDDEDVTGASASS